MTSRRQFIMGCSAAIAAMAGGRVGNLVFADQLAQAGGNDEILVSIFLRGGCDGLSLVVPYDDPNYATARGGIAVTGALNIDPKNATFTSSLGLHPNAAPLKELYDGGHLAIVHAAGLTNDTRSHFDAMDYIERGVPGNKNMSSGWLARHLQCAHPDGLLPTLAASAAAPSSLLSEGNAVAMNDPKGYNLSGPWQYTTNNYKRSDGTYPYKDAMLNTLDKFYTGETGAQAAGKRTIETIKVLRSVPDYTPLTTYPSGSFGDSLKMVAQMIKLDLGLRVATVDLGGWDHHESEGVNETWGPFYRLIATLSQGLHAFFNDLPDHQGKITVVTMSEFGRRLGANSSNGTDHGHGGVALVLGGTVNGGQVYGTWPGLAPEQLDQRQDLAVTTDFRTIMSEILVRRLQNYRLGAVFPGLDSYTPLGILKGSDPDPSAIDWRPGLYQGFLPMVVR